MKKTLTSRKTPTPRRTSVKQTQSSLLRALNLMFEAGTLRKTARSHRQLLLTNDISDNISSHSYRTALIGYLLAKHEHADPYKVVIMCLIHDLGEARSGDMNWVHKKYVKTYEEEIARDQFDGLTEDNELYTVAKEYDERISKEAILAKDADLLELILLLKEHAQIGNKQAQSWLNTKEQLLKIRSTTAKRLAKLTEKTEVNDWWDKVWSAERRS